MGWTGLLYLNQVAVGASIAIALIVYGGITLATGGTAATLAFAVFPIIAAEIAILWAIIKMQINNLTKNPDRQDFLRGCFVTGIMYGGGTIAGSSIVARFSAGATGVAALIASLLGWMGFSLDTPNPLSCLGKSIKP